MILNVSNNFGGGKNSLPVEWHDCAWQPAIRRRAARVPQPVRCQTFFSPMTKIANRNSSAGNFRAFTLVELLVVIAIIGILAAMLLPVLAKVKDSANKAKAKTEMADIVNAINAYDTDYGRFPMTADEQAYVGTNDFTTGFMQNPQLGISWATPPPTTAYSYYNNSNTIAILMDLTTYPNGNNTCNTNHIKTPESTRIYNIK